VVLDENGHFEIAVIVDPEWTEVDEWGWTFDPHGEQSNYSYTEVGEVT
jgi:hypothetical protein